MQKNTIISIIIGLVVIAGAFLVVFGSSLKNLKQETPTDTTPIVVTPVTKPMTSSTPTPSGYTLADVKTHNSATSCWSAINGNVYDLTSWVNAHPGGRMAILMICGKDGSPLFNTQHGGQNKPASILTKFKIGALN